MKKKNIYSVLLLTFIILLILGSVSATENTANPTKTSDTNTISNTSITSTDESINQDTTDKSEIKIENKSSTYKKATNTKSNAQMSLSNKNIVYGNNISINTTVKNTDGTNINTGKVVLYLNSQKIRTTTPVNGVATFNIGLKNVGKYNLTTEYINSKYNNISKNAILTVTKAKATVSMQSKTYTYGKNITVTANVTGSTVNKINNGRIDLYLNNAKIRSITPTNSKATFTIGLKNVGKYTLKAVYVNNNYNSQNATATLTVNKATATVTTSYRSFAYGRNITLNANITSPTVDSINNGKLELYLNGTKIRSITPKDGKVTFNIGLKNYGIYPIKMVYENKNYNSKNTNNTFMVYKVTPTISLYTSSYDYGEIAYATAHVTRQNDDLDINNGRIDLYLDNKKIRSATPKNGYVSFKIGLKNAGSYNLEARYINPNYYQKSDKDTLIVYPLYSQISLYDMSFTEGNSITFNSYVFDENYNSMTTGKVELYLNNKLIKTSKVSDGTAYFNIGTKKAGTYSLQVKYIDKNYIQSTNTSTLTVKAKPSPYKTVELLTPKSYSSKIVGTDEFIGFYTTYYGEDTPGVYVKVLNYGNKKREWYSPENIIVKAKFYFKNSKGNVITRTSTEGTGIYIYHNLISGYTPYKVVATYRKMTSAERWKLLKE